MYIRKVTGYIVPYITKSWFDTFEPVIQESNNWKRWITHIGPNTCFYCFTQNGVILPIDEDIDIPVHPNCHCEITTKIAIIAGTATVDGDNGADYYLKYSGQLPDYYITINDAKKLGWKAFLGNLDKVAPGKQLTKGIYRNYDGHLPSRYGRTWYEADINYSGGFRNSMRIVYSNDGLIFVTYDHYKTFYEIV
ncbi:MAG: phage head morphogenesis protein [Clostridiales bacterium]|nr:phage head morphogenesis protein [Clostridiales bacterium]